MADCPYCDDWRYDALAACVGVRPVSYPFPVVYQDGELRRARGSEAPNGKGMATALHISREHPMEPEVLLLGPLEEYAPLRALVAFLGT